MDPQRHLVGRVGSTADRVLIYRSANATSLVVPGQEEGVVEREVKLDERECQELIGVLRNALIQSGSTLEAGAMDPSEWTSPRQQVYSLSRRFGLLTIVAATVIWAAVLTLCRIVDMPRDYIAANALLLLVVAMTQSLFAPMDRPRTVSIFTGIVYAGMVSLLQDGSVSIPLLVLGAFYGYVAGVCIATAVMFTAAVDRKFGSSASGESTEEEVDSPFDLADGVSTEQAAEGKTDSS